MYKSSDVKFCQDTVCQQLLKSFHFWHGIQKHKSCFLDHSVMFDIIDWLFKARTA